MYLTLGLCASFLQEQSGLAGQIQVTQSVVDAAGDNFTFELRGTLAIKGMSHFHCLPLSVIQGHNLKFLFVCIGKGPMDVFMLKSAKPNDAWRHSMILTEKRRKSQRTLRCNSII